MASKRKATKFVATAIVQISSLSLRQSSAHALFVPTFGMTGLRPTPISILPAKVQDDNDPEIEGRGPVRYISRLFQRDRRKPAEKDVVQKPSKSGESVVVRLVNRVSGKSKEDKGASEPKNEQESSPTKPAALFSQPWLLQKEAIIEEDQQTIENLRKRIEKQQKERDIEREKRQMEARKQEQAKNEQRQKMLVQQAREKAMKQKEAAARKKQIQVAAGVAVGKTVSKNETDTGNTRQKNPRSGIQKLFSRISDNWGKEEWIVVCPKTMLAPGEIVPVTANGLDLLVIASKDGRRLYCIANSCPHLGTPLETGLMERRPIASNHSDPTAATHSERCEDCIVCPLHRTSFALSSGEVRGEWCPYPPVIGPMMGAVRTETPLAVFDVRARKKNVEVRINSLVDDMGNRAEKEDGKEAKEDQRQKEKGPK